MTTIILDGVQLIDGFTPNPDPFPSPEPFPFPPVLERPVRPIPPIRPFPVPMFRECTPKILVVTDGLNFNSGSSTGLTEFVDTIKASTIHGMTPEVITAQYNPAGVLSYNAVNKHISNYHFTDGSHGLLKSRYDVVFILSTNSANGSLLASEAGALDRIVDFMQAGGGLFCTGDHYRIGAGMCADIPRVNKMRKWWTGVPTGGGRDRHTTNGPGANDIYENIDQSDEFPQRLFPNYRSIAGGFDDGVPTVGAAHPILQLPGEARSIEVLPDHPHEGECLVPTSAAGSLPNGSPEWPNGLLPEMVGLIMSHGDGVPGKEAVEPKAFVAATAYNGHDEDIGRVVTDSTWHHFVNMNIKPSMTGMAGRNLTDIQQYYVNLADWLMPKNVRWCLRYPWILSAVTELSLLEELPEATLSKLSTSALQGVGIDLKSALLKRHTKAQVADLMHDIMEHAVGAKMLAALRDDDGKDTFEETELIALGAFTMATIERFNTLVEKGELNEKADLNGEEAFKGVGQKEVTRAVKIHLKDKQQYLNKRMKFIESAIK